MMKKIHLLALTLMVGLSAAATDYQVSIKVTNDTGVRSSTMPIANIYGKDGKHQGFAPAGEWTYQLPSGSYIFTASCSVAKESSLEEESGMIVIPVEVADADTEVVRDISEVRNRLTFVCHTQNGEVIALPEFDWETGSYIEGSGNITGKIQAIDIYHSEFGLIGGGGGNTCDSMFPQDSFWVNDLDENISVWDVELLATDEGFCLTASEAVNGVKGNLTLELGKAYAYEYEPRFQLSPIGQTLRDNGEMTMSEYACDLAVHDRGLQISSSMAFPFVSPVGKVYYDEAICNGPFKAGVAMHLIDSFVQTETGLTTFPISDMPVLLGKSEPEFFFLNLNSSFRMSDDGFLVEVQNEGHPMFSHTASQRLQVPGDNCPLTILCPSYYNDWMNPENSGYRLSVGGTGRLGEQHYGYYSAFRYDDEKTWIEGVEVDGLSGKSTFRYEPYDGDPRMALIQQVQFRNSDDKVTDRFDTAAEGRLLLAGGDFIPNMNRKGGIINFSIGEIDLSVEYSPFQAEEWSVLDVEEIPDCYFEPGYGYFYEGSLASVDTPSSTGWYDLKMTLTGKEGNMTEQVISPAFKIGKGGENGLSAPTVATESDEWFTMEGLKVSSPSKGIYLHRTPAGVKKVIR